MARYDSNNYFPMKNFKAFVAWCWMQKKQLQWGTYNRTERNQYPEGIKAKILKHFKAFTIKALKYRLLFESLG